MRILQSLLLLIVAIVLWAILIPIAFIFEGLVRLIRNAETADYRLKCARSIDQTANAVGGFLFSLLFTYVRNDDYTLHWDEDFTISTVLYKNYKTNNLSLLGKHLYFLLEWLDPWHGQHSENTD